MKNRMATKTKNQALFFGLSTVALIAAIQFNLSRIESIEALEQDDLSSLKNSKVARQTNLGRPQAVQRQNKNEVDLLMMDPAMSQKWDLSLTKTTEAWTRLRALGDKKVKVCVIDTGADIYHSDLKNNLWENEGEMGLDLAGRNKSNNGIDDDMNGYIDDVHGFNFVDNNNNLKDNHGHGTHIAGAIGAQGGNGIGISGVAPRVSLVIAKYYDPTSSASNNLMNTVRAIRYCVAVESDIINYSGGGLEPSEKERDAVALAREKGILFVAAAGNEQSNSDVRKYYPADYDLDNIISVTAVDRDRNVLPSSNYGEVSVDIAAPGKNIYSTLPGGQYGYMTGTSQATAIVTGVAALLKAKYTDFDAARIARHITETGDLELEKLNGKTRNKKRLNAYRALAILDQGVTVTGGIPTNATSLKSESFSVSASDLTNNEGSTTITPEGLVGFGRDIRKLLNESEKQRAR